MTIIHKNAGIFADFLADYLKGAIKTYKIHFPQITLKSILKDLSENNHSGNFGVQNTTRNNKI